MSARLTAWRSFIKFVKGDQLLLPPLFFDVGGLFAGWDFDVGEVLFGLAGGFLAAGFLRLEELGLVPVFEGTVPRPVVLSGGLLGA